MKKFKWEKALIVNPLFGFAVGHKVLVTPSDIKHTSIGRTWFVFDGKSFLQVAESGFGRNLCQLVKSLGAYDDNDSVNSRFAKYYDNLYLKG